MRGYKRISANNEAILTVGAETLNAINANWPKILTPLQGKVQVEAARVYARRGTSALATLIAGVTLLSRRAPTVCNDCY